MRNTCLYLCFLLLATSLAGCAAPQVSTDYQQLDRDQQNLSRQLLQLQTELTEVRAQLKEQGQTLAELQVAATSIASAPSAVGQSGPDAASGETELSPTEVYRKAFDDFAFGRYNQAIVGFTRFVDNFPDSRYTGTAYYWLGESYMSQQDYGRAVETFQVMADRFPDSPKAPDALLKVARAKLLLGEPELAEEAMQALRERYPKSSAAKKTLENLNR